MIDFLKTALIDRRIAQKERQAYYSNTLFAQRDKALCRLYRYKDPFAISRAYLKKKGYEDIHMYGETPLMSLDKLARKVGLCADDCIVDLGAGRGRSLLFWHSFYGCKGVGYEHIPEFCSRSNPLFDRFQLPLILKNQSMLTIDESPVSVAYLYGSNLDDATIQSLVQRLKQLPHLRAVISISFALSDYACSNWLGPAISVPVLFNWGRTRAFIQEVEANKSQNATPWVNIDSSITK